MTSSYEPFPRSASGFGVQRRQSSFNIGYVIFAIAVILMGFGLFVGMPTSSQMPTCEPTALGDIASCGE